jgi:hypothetical protein
VFLPELVYKIRQRARRPVIQTDSLRISTGARRSASGDRFRGREYTGAGNAFTFERSVSIFAVAAQALEHHGAS